MIDLLEQADQPQIEYTPVKKKRRRHTIETVVIQPDDPSIRYIPLTRGFFAIVDAFLFSWLMQWNWIARQNKRTGMVYAERAVYENGKLRSALPMHRAIVGLQADDVRWVDHQSRNGLDNRGQNLRIADASKNACNRSKNTLNKSGYKGVSWHKHSSKWVVQIEYDRKQYWLGYFPLDKLEDAARVYDRKARELQGEFAVLNFPDEA